MSILGGWLLNKEPANQDLEHCLSELLEAPIDQVMAYSNEEWVNPKSPRVQYATTNKINIITRKRGGDFWFEVDVNYDSSIELANGEYGLLGKVCEWFDCQALAPDLTQDSLLMYLILDSQRCQHVAITPQRYRQDEYVIQHHFAECLIAEIPSPKEQWEEWERYLTKYDKPSIKPPSSIQ